MVKNEDLSNVKKEETANSQLIAKVHEVEGQLILEDPIAIGVINAINKTNCNNTYVLNLDRIVYFANRAAILEKTEKETVIVLINVDDKNGNVLANTLMPNYNWQQYRDIGQIPYARGLANRNLVQDYLSCMDEQAADKLAKMTELAVVVVDYGVAEVFEMPSVIKL